jgi:hypothetical protein
MFYAISPDGKTVLSYKRIANATDKATELSGFVGSDATETDTGLTNVPTPVLVLLHNAIRPEKPVTRFADRKTGETRLKGVLEVLSKPGDIVEVPEVVVEEEAAEEYIPDPALSAEENEQMAAAKKGAKKGAAKKTTKKAAGAPKATISEAVVNRVIKMRADGKAWPEILTTLGETNSFVHRVRPLMKKVDKSSVKKMGPGSPNYGKGKK